MNFDNLISDYFPSLLNKVISETRNKIETAQIIDENIEEDKLIEEES